MPAEDVIKTTYSVLPLIAIIIPLTAAAIIMIVGDRLERFRNLISILAAALTFGVVLTILVKVLGGNALHFNLRLIEVGGKFSFSLVVDSLGAFFALIASILWLAAIIHSSTYMFHEHKRTRFFSIMMIVEAATLGIFMVHDYFSLFVFFELMGLATYFLVIHSETEIASSAANKYLYMTVISGLSLLMGIFLYLNYSGTVCFIPSDEGTLVANFFTMAALFCTMLGFGIKAGIVPVHIWLPDAHPVAPSPASAILSGVLIKVGAYGILRVITSFFYIPFVNGTVVHNSLVIIDVGGSLSQNVQSVGFILIWLAIATMFIGMVLAIIESDIKRALAYSSVSQMGFILFGIGCLVYLGNEGAIGLSGSLFHVFNHAFYKACLFLAAGTVIYYTHESNMYKLGGLWRKMPFTTLLWCVAALGMVGMPFLNGFISKSLLHHAIAEAQHLATQEMLFHAGWLQIAGIFYTIVSVGTVLYLVKMTYYIFFHAPSLENTGYLEKIKETPTWMTTGVGMLALGILIIGLIPGFFLQNLVIPVVEIFRGFDPHTIEQLSNFTVFSWTNIREILLPFALGVAIFILGIVWGSIRNRVKEYYPFYLKLPSWISFEYWYLKVIHGIVLIYFMILKIYERIKLVTVTVLRRSILTIYLIIQTVYKGMKLAIVSIIRRNIIALFLIIRNIYTETKLALKKNFVIFTYLVVRRLLPLILEHSGDIALGALAIVISLIILLTVTLF
ncbi:MAG: hypothetical protein JSV74_03565 [Dehalococcoidia bacterium]|nr:MAG: hypothetical protein JSV74_03565 [Dehalococcoidia bacterium]